jgi:hypothetical protein
MNKTKGPNLFLSHSQSFIDMATFMITNLTESFPCFVLFRVVNFKDKSTCTETFTEDNGDAKSAKDIVNKTNCKN